MVGQHTLGHHKNKNGEAHHHGLLTLNGTPGQVVNAGVRDLRAAKFLSVLFFHFLKASSVIDMLRLPSCSLSKEFMYTPE